MADILLVADVPWIVNDVRAALSQARFSVSTVDDPRAVTERISESAPDVLLVDFQVGSMGGMALTRAVRDAAATNGTRPPVILLLDRDADAFLAGRSGADGWVLKPFSSDALRAAIDKVLTAAPDPS
ncbi:MAG: response regulator [Acidimicrobiia bacterium]